jgi:hypothetical protein
MEPPSIVPARMPTPEQYVHQKGLPCLQSRKAQSPARQVNMVVTKDHVAAMFALIVRSGRTSRLHILLDLNQPDP